MNDYRDWFRSATGRRVTAEEVASHLEVSRATATRRLMDGLSADDVIKLSRALHVNPVEALVDLSHLTHGEALDFLDMDGQLVETADEGYLALELARRLNPITNLDDVRRIEDARRSNAAELHVVDVDEDEAALREANELRGAAQKRTPRLDEPDSI